MTRDGWLFVLSVVVFSVSGAVPILVTASQFSETPASVWALVVPACLAAVSGVGALRWRLPTTR